MCSYIRRQPGLLTMLDYFSFYISSSLVLV